MPNTIDEIRTKARPIEIQYGVDVLSFFVHMQEVKRMKKATWIFLY